MNQVLAFVIVLAVVAVVAGDDKPGTAPTIRGKWEVTAATFNGTTFTGPKGRVMVFGEDDLTTFDGGAPTRFVSYTLDTTTDPRRIDLDTLAGENKALGIYAVDKNELKICYAEHGAGRPARFESKPGDRVYLIVLKRVKE